MINNPFNVKRNKRAERFLLAGCYAEIIGKALLTLLLILGIAGFSTQSYSNQLENIKVENSISDEVTTKSTVSVNHEINKTDKTFRSKAQDQKADTAKKTMSVVKIVIQIGMFIGVLLGGAITIQTYISSVKVRRAEWLHTLYRSFYEQNTYDEMRRILDYKGSDFDILIEQLSDNSGQQHTLREKLVDYLNFFEFIASLWKIGQLETDEILMLFDYYIRCLSHNKVVRDYVRLHGFEGLNQLIEEAESQYVKNHGAGTSMLFVYGTLMSNAENSIADLLSRHASKVSSATYQGKMYLVTRPDGTLQYPSVVPSEDLNDFIHGELFRFHEPTEIFSQLDIYEECSPSCPQPHEYRREIVHVQGPSGEAVRTFIYLYNRSTVGLPLIEGGSFEAHKNL